MASSRQARIGLSFVAVVGAAVFANGAHATDIVSGDVMASTNNGTVTVYDHNLNFVETPKYHCGRIYHRLGES